jgi:hypothetical protein
MAPPGYEGLPAQDDPCYDVALTQFISKTRDQAITKNHTNRPKNTKIQYSWRQKEWEVSHASLLTFSSFLQFWFLTVQYLEMV